MDDIKNFYLAHKKACTVELASKIITHMRENGLTLDCLDEVYEQIKETYTRHAMMKSDDMVFVEDLSRATV